MTVLSPFGLHRWVDKGWRFADPDVDLEIGRSLVAAWDVITEHPEISLDEICRLWAKPPYGLKRGVMPVLALAYILAKRSALAVYVGEVFQPEIEPLLFDRILQSPAEIRIKHIDRTQEDLAVLRTLSDGLGLPEDASSLEVTSKLYQRFEALPRTASGPSVCQRRLGRCATSFRGPATLRLSYSAISSRSSLRIPPWPWPPCRSASPPTTNCEPTFIRALQNALAAPEDFAGLGARASHVVDCTGELRFDAFANRAAMFELGNGDIEGLASRVRRRGFGTSGSRREREGYRRLIRGFPEALRRGTGVMTTTT